ncbi:arabinofuranosyltransferase [Actinokineospora pegani]|uniref:arabinofuranosyltransferase n=1 Tax=Actinokineospora pegani TaxID=2654637 RepID=UPI0012E9D989|nr:arabinofuranosyltransferase [Actinokineospora pegani]
MSASTTENSTVAAPAAEDPAPPPGRVRSALLNPSVVAVLAWLVFTPIALLLERAGNDIDPFSMRGAFMPLAAGGVLLAVGFAVACWKRAGEWVAGLGAGLFAAWLAFALQTALNGTPFGFSGLVGDMSRMSAAAVRYTATFWSSDAFVRDVPSEYPPLFPWVVGRTSLLLDIPAWRLLGVAEVLLASLSVVAAFVLWRRLLPAGTALVISASGLLVWGDPRKSFAVIALFVFIPWVICTFANPARGRLHWLPAGAIGGLIFITYFGWYPFGLLGVLAVAVVGLLRSSAKARYVTHVLLSGVVLLVVSSPFLIPYVHGLLTTGGQGVSDLYQSWELPENGFPFLEPTILGAVQLVGIAGLVWYRKRSDWAWPMLYLLIGAYAFWVIMGVRFVLTEHTTLLHYVPRLVGAVLVAAGVITLATAAPALARRFSFATPTRVGASVVVVALVWVGFTYWDEWRPRPWLAGSGVLAERGNHSTFAHLEPQPDCGYPRFAPADGRIPCLPVTAIQESVESVRGADSLPTVLSPDERLYSFLPWWAYMGSDRTSASSLARWDDRRAALAEVVDERDPAAFTEAVDTMQYGPIDVFLLRETDDPDRWRMFDETFERSQFDPAVWTVDDTLDAPFVVITRKP